MLHIEAAVWVHRQPGMAAAAILALAIGIGACAATWSLISALLLHPLPVKEPERLFWSKSQPDDATSSAVDYPTYKQIREAEIFDGLAANGVFWFSVSLAGAPQPRPVCFVSHDYFDTLGIQIQSGRNFSPDDDRRSALPTAIISHRLWSSAFPDDGNAIGRPITIGGVQAVVVGIAPREFPGLNLANPADIYMPIHAVGAVGDRVTNYFSDPIPPAASSPSTWIGIAGRLKPGMTAGETARRLNSLLSREPGSGRWTLTNVNTMAIPVDRSGTVKFSQLLAMTVGLILLIGCLSTGMLLLVRTEARKDEFAMRLALGASRARLVQGIMVEGVVLSLAGAVLALPVSDILLKGLQTFELPGRIRISSINLAVDGRVLAALGSAAVAACMLIALVAAVYGFSVDVGSGLRARTGATRKTRSVLVAAHVAVALVLLSGAGLLVRSLVEALRLNSELETGQIVTGRLSLSPYGYTPARSEELFRDLRQRLAGNPSIESASFSMEYVGMSQGGSLTIDGIERTPPGYVRFVFVDDRFFRTMGMNITRGREFSTFDVDNGSPVAIVSDSFSRLLPHGDDPLGKSLTEPIGQPGKHRVLQIVGIAPDVIDDINVLEPIVVYSPFVPGHPTPDRTLVLRASGAPKRAVQDAMGVIRQLDGSVVAAPLRTIDQRLQMQMGPQQLGASVLGSLGIIAAFLSMLAIYVLATSSAIQRQDELRIRAALGARGRQLVRPMIAETTRLVGIGLAIGLLLTWMGESLIAAFLYRVRPLDPAALGTASAGMLVIAVAVSLAPALRSIRQTDAVRLLKLKSRF